MELIDREALLKDVETFCGDYFCHDEGSFDKNAVRMAFKLAPVIDAVEVVRCKNCIWWKNRQVMLDDGNCRDYLPNEPWLVTMDVGINIGSHCTKHGFEDKSGSWFWSCENDYCSRGERREGEGGQ